MTRWIHTGGGYYENEDTGERIRGKANLPGFEESVKESESKGFRLACMTCRKVTEHTPRSGESLEWKLYTCSECGGKTRVSLR